MGLGLISNFLVYPAANCIKRMAIIAFIQGALLSGVEGRIPENSY